MLYFRFNTDNFIEPKQMFSVTHYKDGKPISKPIDEICTLKLGEIIDFFFKKLRDELSLEGIGIGSALYDLLDIPIDAFSINDEMIGNFDGTIKYVLSEYAKLPIEELDNKSLYDLGISIEFCKRSSNKNDETIISDYMQQNGFDYVYEEVLWKNMTDKEKIEKFSTNFSKVEAEGKELIIVDPYLFNDSTDDYCDMLASIINHSDAQSVVVITDNSHYKKISYDKVANKVNRPISNKFSGDFHDRFWIAGRKKGFCTGTSLNGIGKRISIINLLSEDDVSEIIKELCKQRLIS
uniref:hypothetical protein n=1 Tax=Enterocloster clostridioformis TaxID=1531 RepID=UPI003AB6FA09